MSVPRPRKVLHVISSLLVGGAEMLLVRLVGPLRKRGWESSVLTLSDEGPLRAVIVDHGARLVTAGWQSGRVPRPHDIARLLQVARTERCDVVQGWMPHGNLGASLASKLMPGHPPVLWAIHQSLDDLMTEKPLTRAVIRVSARLSRGVERIVYVSRVSQRQHEALGFAREPALWIPNGVDTDEFQFDADARERIRGEFGIPLDALVVGHLGRFHEQKDYGTLAGAIKLLLARLPECHVLLAGRGIDAANRALTDQLPLADFGGRIHLAGQRSDVPKLLSTFDLLCLSSAFGEAFPTVLLEAMSVGLPCVATDVGDCRSILGDDEAIVPPRDAAALAEAIELKLGAPAGGDARIRQRAVAEYSIERAAQAYADAYDRVVMRRAGH